MKYELKSLVPKRITGMFKRGTSRDVFSGSKIETKIIRRGGKHH